jgi:uncharacterized protein YndB with AHSA1/START domain
VTGPHSVAVSVRIAAAPESVFPYLTDPARYVEWMGSEARLEPVPGGQYRVAMADGFAAAGTFAEVQPPRRLAFSWGWADDEAARHVRHEPGSTRVVVTLAAEDGGTRLDLQHHDLPTAELRDAHREAWEAYLARLSIRAAGGDPGPDPHSQRPPG